MKKDDLNKKKGIWGAIGAVALLAATKLKWLLVILKFAKISTIISLVISLGAYGLAYGWSFAFSIIYLMLVHEFGHYIACKIKGIPVKPTLFIPFVGAAVRMSKMPTSAQDNAFIAYMGPVFGLLSIIPAVILYALTESPLWLVVISIGSLLNLFNLIPFGGLDGGKIVAGINTKLWFVGLILIISFVIYTHSILATFIAILGVIHLWYFHKKNKTLAQDKEALSEIRAFYNHLVEHKADKELFISEIKSAHTSETHFKLMDLYEEFVESLKENQSEASLEVASTTEDQETTPFIDLAYETASARYLQELNKWLEEEEEELNYADSYNHISKKSRFTTFAIYVALIVVLSVTLDISKEMVHANPEAQAIMKR